MEELMIPFEADPEVFTRLANNMLQAEGLVKVADVWDLSDECLRTLGGRVLGLMLVYNLNERTQARPMRVVEAGGPQFMAQTQRNTCGPVGLTQILLNAGPAISQRLALEQHEKVTPAELGRGFEKNDAIQKALKQFAKEGSTRPPEDLNDVQDHFVSFIFQEGHLWEMDGRFKGPIDHGPTSEAEWTERAFDVIRTIAAADPGNCKMSCLALVAPQTDMPHGAASAISA